MAAGFGTIGAIMLWREVSIAPYLLGIAAAFLAVGILAPPVLRPVEMVWMKLAAVLGFVMTNVILTLVYLLILTPIGLVMRIMGKKFLNLRFDRGQKSYWIRANAEGTADRPEKPF